MKSFAILVLSGMLFVFGCREGTGASTNAPANKNETFSLDTSVKDTVLRHVQLHSNKYFSSFETPAEVRFFSGGVVIDSIIESDFRMTSWYSIRKDTIDLVAHVGEFETAALLIRFLKEMPPRVYYFRASHERQKYFRLTATDSFSDHLEVPPVSYHLILSVVPDSIHKPKVFGSIDMESGTYYDQRDSLKKRKVQMKFYFCSQFRSFDYPQ